MKHVIAITMLVCIVPGCESPAQKLAIAGGVRSTAVQQWVVHEMHSELTKALFRETREKIENQATAAGRASELNRLGGRLDNVNHLYRQYQDAQAIHDATVMAHLESSGSVFGMAAEALKARVASMPVPGNAPNAEQPTTQPVSMDKTRPSTDGEIRRSGKAKRFYADATPPDGWWRDPIFQGARE